MTEDMVKVKEMFLGMIPPGTLEAKGDLEFLKGCVEDHIKRLKALSARLSKEEFHIVIELQSLIVQLEIALKQVNSLP